jgi:hypothetical protein
VDSLEKRKNLKKKILADNVILTEKTTNNKENKINVEKYLK